MPAYDYKCTICDDVFEVRHGVGEKPQVKCPSCNEQAKRVFTPPGVVFKGSGFHNTDYRKKPAEKADKPEKPSGKPAEGSCPKKDSASPACSSCPAAE